MSAASGSAPALAAVQGRRSYPVVTDDAPDHAELVRLVDAAATVADHGSLRPWRLIEVRGEARSRLGDALVAALRAAPVAASKVASGDEAVAGGGAAAGAAVGATADSPEALRLAAKPLRAPLVVAVVAVRRESHKVAEWEQDAAASGVAHVLSLLLDEAGWGVMWRTGPHTRSPEVHRALDLADNEKLLGWLYVGGKPEQPRPPREPFDVAGFVSELN